jgi:hypothetical protein
MKRAQAALGIGTISFFCYKKDKVESPTPCLTARGNAHIVFVLNVIACDYQPQ